MEPLRGQTKAAMPEDARGKEMLRRSRSLEEKETDQEDDRGPGGCVREKYVVPQPAVRSTVRLGRVIVGALSDHRCLRTCLRDRRVFNGIRFVLSQGCCHGRICDTWVSSVASRHDYGAVFIFDVPDRSKAILIPRRGPQAGAAGLP